MCIRDRYGTVHTATFAWDLGDLGVGLMAWLNIIAILLMHKVAYKCLKDYEQQLDEGKDPVFHPEKLGITNADYWDQAPSKDDNLTAEKSAAQQPQR